MSEKREHTPPSRVETEILEQLKRMQEKLTFLERKIDTLLHQAQSTPRPSHSAPRHTERSSEKYAGDPRKKAFTKAFRSFEGGKARPEGRPESPYAGKKPSFGKKKPFGPRSKDRPK